MGALQKKFDHRPDATGAKISSIYSIEKLKFVPGRHYGKFRPIILRICSNIQSVLYCNVPYCTYFVAFDSNYARFMPMLERANYA